MVPSQPPCWTARFRRWCREEAQLYRDEHLRDRAAPALLCAVHGGRQQLLDSSRSRGRWRVGGRVRAGEAGGRLTAPVCLLQRVHSQLKKEVSEARGGRRRVSEPAEHGCGFWMPLPRGLQQPAGGSLLDLEVGASLLHPRWALPTRCRIDTLPGSVPLVSGWELVVVTGSTGLS